MRRSPRVTIAAVALLVASRLAAAPLVEVRYDDGGVYYGETASDGRTRHGQGTYWYPSGQEYTGGWVEGKKDGHGVLRWPSGNRYIGEWKNNAREGWGRVYTADGEITTGRWQGGELVETGFQGTPLVVRALYRQMHGIGLVPQLSEFCLDPLDEEAQRLLFGEEAVSFSEGEARTWCRYVGRETELIRIIDQLKIDLYGEAPLS